MVERIKANPPSSFHIIDNINIKFLIHNQTIYECWYALNLGIECCECEDRD